MALSRIFDLSNRSLAAYKNALDVTANNIANASNENYSRQKVTFASEKADISGVLRLGSGVKLSEVSRVRNSYIDNQIQEKNTSYQYNSKKSEVLGRMEDIFLETTGSGFSNSLNEFFNSWQELSSNPTSVGLRNDVLNSAKSLSSRTSDILDGLDDLKYDVVSDYREKVDSLNLSLKNLKAINVEIKSQQGNFRQSPDLLDERDKILKELSSLANIKVEIGDDEIAQVSIGGISAADASMVKEFSVSITDGELGIVTSKDGKKATLKGGELGGLSDVYNESIPAVEENFLNIVETLKNAVNDAHSTGYSITDPPQTGTLFFIEGPAGELQINSAILNDLDMLATSGDGTNGNSDNALAIASLLDAKLLNGDDLTSNYTEIISNLGNQVQLSENMATANNLSLEQLDSAKNEVSGVSIDEEMTNIIQYQRSYDASAKLIKVADEMLQTILNMV